MKPFFALGAALGLSACAPLPDLVAGPDPTDPSIPVPAVAYRPVLSGAKRFDPIEPKAWSETNEVVRPRSRAP